MIKKIILLFFCITLLISCGKKGDPEYKDSKKLIKTSVIA
tara:strand:+ start:35 stop:154 length:120 start_codon:yes stop_codon:yes gene_type:complete